MVIANIEIIKDFTNQGKVKGGDRILDLNFVVRFKPRFALVLQVGWISNIIPFDNANMDAINGNGLFIVNVDQPTIDG